MTKRQVVAAAVDLPTVFVVVLHWKGLDDTLACLDSLYGLDYARLQVVLVDNGSAERPAAELRRRFPALHVLEYPANLGFTEGNNVGIRYALERGADYVFLLNNDTLVARDMLSRLVAEVDADPTIGLACPAITSMNDPARRYATFIDWDRCIGGEYLLAPNDLANRDVDFAMGCALLARTAVVRDIGLLDPAYFIYYEDVDWSLRCRAAGYRVVIVPQVEVSHRGTPDQVSHPSPFLWYYYLRNQARFIRRHGPRARHWTLLRQYSRECLSRGLDAGRKGDRAQADAILDGWWAGLRGHGGPDHLIAPGWLRIGARRCAPALHWLLADAGEWRRRLSPRRLRRRIFGRPAASP